METQNTLNEPKKKKINDFVLTFIGIGALIAVLMLLKYIMSTLQVI